MMGRKTPAPCHCHSLSFHASSPLVKSSSGMEWSGVDGVESNQSKINECVCIQAIMYYNNNFQRPKIILREGIVCCNSSSVVCLPYDTIRYETILSLFRFSSCAVCVTKSKDNS
mmetsp:Transcript_30298/g.34409  ORF Transcript_30298/g.34409 Transcript_30298/m.34409 type:complete len:114 (+) Transcript_30298:357-698(+)